MLSQLTHPPISRRLLPLLVLLAALAATLLPWQLGIGLAAGLVVVPLVLRWPLLAVYLLILSVPVQTVINLPAGLTVTQVVMALTVAVWWASMALRSNHKFLLNGFSTALGLYITVMVLSLVVATSFPDSLAEIARWLVTALSYVIVINTVQGRMQTFGLVACLLLSGTIEGALGSAQALLGLVPESFYAASGEDVSARGFGTIGMPNSYAGFLNMSLPLALALAIYFVARLWADMPKGDGGRFSNIRQTLQLPHIRRDIVLAAGATFATAAMGLGLLLSYSRGGYIGFGFGILFMAVALGRRAAPVLGLMTAGAVVMALMFWTGTLPAGIADRISSITNQLRIYDVRGVTPTPENYAQVERLVHWQVAGNMFLSDPWLGVGIGNFNPLFVKFGIQGWPYSRGHAHNYFLHALAETGVIGLFAYLVLLGTAIFSGWRARAMVRDAGSGPERALIIGAFGVLWAIIGHSVFEDLHVLNMGIHWVAVIALFTLVPRMAMRDA